MSWRNRTFTKESIRLAGLPCLLPRHVAICQQVQLSQDLLQPIDRVPLIHYHIRDIIYIIPIVMVSRVSVS